MTDLRTHEFELAAQEMAMHVSMCVSAEYINSWGLRDYLQKLFEYVDDPDLELIVMRLQQDMEG